MSIVKLRSAPTKICVSKACPLLTPLALAPCKSMPLAITSLVLTPAGAVMAKVHWSVPSPLT